MRLSLYVATSLLTMAATVNAATLIFDSNPLPVPDPTPATREVVGGLGTEFNFALASDVAAIDFGAFGVGPLMFRSDTAANLPSSGVNFVVLQEFGPPMNAGIAQDLIGGAITDPGPGFFIYFNTGLGVPRLVFSRDLSDPDADLAILGRLVGLTQADVPLITSANIAAIPEPLELCPDVGAFVVVWFLLGCVPAPSPIVRSEPVGGAVGCRRAVVFCCYELPSKRPIPHFDAEVFAAGGYRTPSACWSFLLSGSRPALSE